MTLKELHAGLAERGVAISYSALSEFVGTDDIADQLQVTGSGSRREFLPDALDVLASFLPEYRQAKGRLPQAGGMLRSFLKQTNPDGGALVPTSRQALAARFSETPELAALAGSVQQLVCALTEKLPPPDDSLLTADQAAQLLACSPATVRKRVKPVLRGRWRRSDVLRYIQDLHAR
jgi:hypothetical protein